MRFSDRNNSPANSLSGRDALLAELTAEIEGAGKSPSGSRRHSAKPGSGLPRVEDVPGYRQFVIQKKVVARFGVDNPFFRLGEGMPRDQLRIAGTDCLNFSTYDYLGLNGSDAVNEAAEKAIHSFGTTAGASRMASGERPPHRALEEGIRDFIGAEDCLTFISGYMTNTSVISHLFGKNDLVALDALSHNSLVMGSVFSGAARFMFPHNDMEALERHLAENRSRYDRVLLVTEGLFSMDGTIGNIPELIRIKKRHGCFLMVDDAHSLGVLGKSGRGAAEHFGVPQDDIDISMGTLSKTLCGCGGYVVGSRELISYLRYTAPGFLYSVAMSPPLAAASLAALEETWRQPERIGRLWELGEHFLRKASDLGLDTGQAVGRGIVPVFTGNSMVAAYMSNALFDKGINVLPVVHPVVPEGSARLRFFLNVTHTREQIDRALDAVVSELPEAWMKAEAMVGNIEVD